MPKYLIEREIPGAGNLTGPELQAISQKSCSVLQNMGPEIQWVESYVTGDKVYCVYISPNEEMIREHASQGGFLDTTQGMSSYLRTMDDLSRMVAKMSGRFKQAEGWRRHLHWGFCDADRDPLRDALGRRYLINRTYERSLEHGA